jgi:uncharacterized protein DUF6191
MDSRLRSTATGSYLSAYPGGMTQWGLETLFNPAKRHMEEEKRRLESTREEIGDSSGGQRIDLESGKVTIKRPAKKAQSDPEESAEDPD